ncbi:hypothetical protein [Calycomorphotria hydatis]|uniref:hypothetical protein n=1 Tax=Calycomorphotria hydatis TaxID=2528027 RepID=UPI0011A5E2A0|nr:hypothetical protein [Calycomorphotria hydatis]
MSNQVPQLVSLVTAISINATVIGDLPSFKLFYFEFFAKIRERRAGQPEKSVISFADEGISRLVQR